MKVAKTLAALALALAVPVTAPVMAQSYQCVPPAGVSLPQAPPQPDGPPRRVPIGGYTLAASWSPEFCRSRGDPAGTQCSGAIGRFGFILHGLWPEARFGPPPQWCATLPRPSAQALRRAMCMTPDARLLEHEWAKHGSCAMATPDAYFRMGRSLWQRVRWPDADALSRRDDLTVGMLRDAFLAANPGWRADMVAIRANPRGWLEEVRLCYSSRTTPAACPRRAAGLPDSAPLKIWRGL